jgi:hypothetical protein
MLCLAVDFFLDVALRLLVVFGVRVVGRTHPTVLVGCLGRPADNAVLVAVALLLDLEPLQLQETRASNHVLEALLLDFLHIALVFQHL